MADVVGIAGAEYKLRNPLGVMLLTLVTLGIYGLVWYYKVNNELRNYGVENNPAVALLAITLGGLLIVPPFVSYYRTADRIRQAQEKASTTKRMIPVLGLLLVMFLSIIALVYYQLMLNRAWEHGAQSREPTAAA